jgi:hypothetical protein
MMTAVFTKWATDLQMLCTPSDETPGRKQAECIECHKQADFNLIRLSFTPGLTSVRYSICRKCRGSEKSEILIVKMMKSAWKRGERDASENIQKLVDEAVFQFYLLGF